jgi:transcriptional regulator with XRE-family HTH domain
MLCENLHMTTQSPILSPIPASNSGAVPAVREHFARRLKELRIPRGYPTARSLSRALGIDENRYTRYERAEVEPDLSLLLKICGLLRASPNDLLVPAGFDDQQSQYQAEPSSPPEPAPHPPRVQASNAPAAAPADPQRRRAIMWQLASEVTDARDKVAHAGRTTPQPPLARMQRINRLFGEIEGDAFGTIGRFSEDPGLKTIAGSDAQQIARLVEELITAIIADGR